MRSVVSVCVNVLGIVACALASSCGASSASGPEPEQGSRLPEFAAGSRLQPEYWQIDEQQVFVDFWDSERQEGCAFRPELESGQVHHCLPVRSAYADVFSDDQCLSPLIDPVYAPGVRYALDAPPYTCAAPLRVFQLGSPAPVPKAYYRDNDRCLPANIEANHVFAAAESEVSSDDFAVAHEQPELTSQRIGALTAVSSDGALQRIAGWDTQRKEASTADTFFTGSWGTARPAYDARAYADASCVQTVVAIASACPTSALSLYAGSLNEVGVEVTAGLHELQDGECKAWSGAAGAHYFEIGPTIPAGQFEPAHVVEVGQGRIHRRYYAAQDGDPLLPVGPTLRDSERDEDCVIYDFGSGHGRCLPALAGGYTFADSECLSPVCVTDAGARAPRSCTTGVEDGSGSALPVVRSAGARHGGPIWRLDGNGCTFAGGDGQAAYELGDPIPLEEFAPAELKGHAQ